MNESEFEKLSAILADRITEAVSACFLSYTNALFRPVPLSVVPIEDSTRTHWSLEETDSKFRALLASLPPLILSSTAEPLGPYTLKTSAEAGADASGTIVVSASRASGLILNPDRELKVLRVALTVPAQGHVFVMGQFDAKSEARYLGGTNFVLPGPVIYAYLTGPKEISVGSIKQTTRLFDNIVASHLFEVDSAGTFEFWLVAIGGSVGDAATVYNRTLSAMYFAA